MVDGDGSSDPAVKLKMARKKNVKMTAKTTASHVGEVVGWSRSTIVSLPTAIYCCRECVPIQRLGIMV